MMIKKEELKENINFYSYSSLLIGLFCLMCSVRFLSASPFVEKGITSLLYFFSFSFFLLLLYWAFDFSPLFFIIYSRFKENSDIFIYLL